MTARNISTIASALLIALGCTVMVGWLFKIPTLVQLFPYFVGMVFNTAFLFTMVGCGIFVANIWPKYKNVVVQATGIFVFIFACLVLYQDLFHHFIGIDNWAIRPWLNDPNPTPGRMAPNTSFAFMLVGITLILIPLQKYKNINIITTILIFLTLLLALVGLLIYTLMLEYILSWYYFTRMAVHTATGFIIVCIAVWTLLIQQEAFKRRYESNEERKILLLSGVVLLTLTLITGLASVVAITYSSFSLIQQAFKESMLNKVTIFENEINNVNQTLQSIIKSYDFEQNVVIAAKNKSKATDEKFLLIFADNDVSVNITDNNGKSIYTAGNFIQPDQTLPLNLPKGYSLLWKNGFWLGFRLTIPLGQNKIGELSGQKYLPNINKFYFDYRSLGKSGEILICRYLNDISQAQCFPSRLRNFPFVIDLNQGKQTPPMYFALKGESGAANMLDYRRRRIIAAYSPMDATGLGLVLKRDAQEVYAPINRLFILIFPATIILIFLGLLLLRWLVVPLVKKVIASEKAAIDEREKIEKLKNEFIAVVSHELRTPLTSMRGSIQLLLSGKFGSFSDKVMQLLEISHNNCDRLSNLINNILDVAKTESALSSLNLVPVEINKVVKTAIEENKMHADKLGVTINLMENTQYSFVKGDFERLTQVLNNLLSNAMKFSPPNDVVTVTISRIKDIIRVEVSDNGSGVNPEFENEIFKKFAQADSSNTRKASGTGLGLNISKIIIDAMHGNLNFYNNAEKGATFYFELPIVNL